MFELLSTYILNKRGIENTFLSMLNVVYERARLTPGVSCSIVKVMSVAYLSKIFKKSFFIPISPINIRLLQIEIFFQTFS